MPDLSIALPKCLPNSLWIIVCYLFLASSALSNPGIEALPPRTCTNTVKIIWSFTIENKTSRAVQNAEFKTFGPVKETVTQICRRIISSHPYEIITDSLGNQVLVYSFDEIAPYASKIISIMAELGISGSPKPEACRNMSFWLGPDPYVESDDLRIIKQAKALKQQDSVQTIHSIFKWVSGNLKYTGYISRPRGALYALTHKKGDCTEFMHLFVALCRANHIPARAMAGYICPGNNRLRPSGYHNWAEVHDGKTWQIADPQRGVLFSPSSGYIAMQIFGENPDALEYTFERFVVKGDGLSVTMNP